MKLCQYGVILTSKKLCMDIICQTCHKCVDTGGLFIFCVTVVGLCIRNGTVTG